MSFRTAVRAVTIVTSPISIVTRPIAKGIQTVTKPITDGVIDVACDITDAPASSRRRAKRVADATTTLAVSAGMVGIAHNWDDVADKGFEAMDTLFGPGPDGTFDNDWHV